MKHLWIFDIRFLCLSFENKQIVTNQTMNVTTWNIYKLIMKTFFCDFNTLDFFNGSGRQRGFYHFSVLTSCLLTWVDQERAVVLKINSTTKISSLFLAKYKAFCKRCKVQVDFFIRRCSFQVVNRHNKQEDLGKICSIFVGMHAFWYIGLEKRN